MNAKAGQLGSFWPTLYILKQLSSIRVLYAALMTGCNYFNSRGQVSPANLPEVAMFRLELPDDQSSFV